MEQPHFDDELTTLTARPVIPLEEIDAKIKHKRRWFLSGAFAVAMLLGAASALVSAYFKLRHAPEAEIQSLSVVQPEAQSVPDAQSHPEAEAQAETEAVSVNSAPEVEVVPERAKPRPSKRDADRAETIDVRPRVSEDGDLRSIRDDVLMDRWEERRARRVARRERRRAQHRDRDLSNIDEIFEGPHRP